MLSWLFRPQCAACGAAVAERVVFCETCAGSLLELGPACPRCAEPTAAGASGELAGEGVLCRRCRSAPLPLDQIAAPWRFGGELASAIRRLKFAGRAHVARDLAP